MSLEMAELTVGQFLGLMLVLFAVVLFLGVVIWRFRTLRLYDRAVPGMAKVISVQRQSGEGGTSYASEITFTDLVGEKVYSVAYTRKNVYSVGQNLRIVYDPEKSKRAVPQSSKWNPDKGLLALGRQWPLVLIFLVPGVVLPLIRFGDPICQAQHSIFNDVGFCVEAGP